jgi:hypothetical protein
MFTTRAALVFCFFHLTRDEFDYTTSHVVFDDKLALHQAWRLRRGRVAGG